MSLDVILGEVWTEVKAGRAKHGIQSHLPDGNPYAGLTAWNAYDARRACQDAFAKGEGSWALILIEEVAEALEAAEGATLEEFRDELVQVAAVAVNWIDALDSRATT